MTTKLPVDIINLICEFAAGNNQIWYPSFSPTTHRLLWKRNKFYDCRKNNRQTHLVHFRLYNNSMIVGNTRRFSRCIFLPNSMYFYINFDNWANVEINICCHVYRKDNDEMGGTYYYSSAYHGKPIEVFHGEIIKFQEGERNFPDSGEIKKFEIDGIKMMA